MSSADNITALPWRTSEATGNCNVLADPEYLAGRSVASTGGFASNIPHINHATENIANAAYIVKAANAYPELVRLLQRSHRHGAHTRADGITLQGQPCNNCESATLLDRLEVNE